MILDLSRWHVESDAINQALAMVIEAQSQLPMARFWGGGETASINNIMSDKVLLIKLDEVFKTLEIIETKLMSMNDEIEVQFK